MPANKERSGAAAVEIQTEPWTIVFIDGKMAGATPVRAYDLASGTFRLRMINPEFGIDRVEEVSVPAGEQTTVERRFFGKVRISLLPGSEIFLNGQAIGSRAGSLTRELPCGYHQVRFVNGSAGSQTVTNLLVKDGERVEVP